MMFDQFDRWSIRHASRIDDPAFEAAIEASYSADLFAPDEGRATCRTPVEIDGALWVKVGGCYGPRIVYFDLYHMGLADDDGLTYWQVTSAYYADRERRKPHGSPSRKFYQGLGLDYDGRRYVFPGGTRRYWRPTVQPAPPVEAAR